LILETRESIIFSDNKVDGGFPVPGQTAGTDRELLLKNTGCLPMTHEGAPSMQIFISVMLVAAAVLIAGLVTAPWPSAATAVQRDPSRDWRD